MYKENCYKCDERGFVSEGCSYCKGKGYKLTRNAEDLINFLVEELVPMLDNRYKKEEKEFISNLNKKRVNLSQKKERVTKENKNEFSGITTIDLKKEAKKLGLKDDEASREEVEEFLRNNKYKEAS